MNGTRKAAVAGQFYIGDQDGLTTQVKDCFLDTRGPGKLPEIQDGKHELRGIVVPHAGYMFSGAIAAHAYHALAHDGFADTFIILGPNHTGTGSGVSVMTAGTWETPLGIVPINEAVAALLWTEIIDKDDSAHIYEHDWDIVEKIL